jgi:hypothetical protein
MLTPFGGDIVASREKAKAFVALRKIAADRARPARGVRRPAPHLGESR